MAHSYNKWPNGIEEDCDVSLTQSRYNSNGMNIKGKSSILLDVWTPPSWSGSRRPQSCTPPSYRSTWQVCGCPSSPSPEVLGQFYLTATDSGPLQSKQCVIKAVSAETDNICVWRCQQHVAQHIAQEECDNTHYESDESMMGKCLCLWSFISPCHLI